MRQFTQIDIWTATDFISWVSGLSENYQIALITSLLTILGFVVAFYTATANWRNQMKAQLKLQVAGELEYFFAQVTSNITTARLYVESLIEAVNTIQKGDSIDDAVFSVGYLNGKANEFVSARDELSHASSEVHRLIGRNYTLLTSSLGLLESVKLAAESISIISSKMWIHLPVVNLQDPNHIQSFLNQVNVTECSEFIQSCNVNYGKISGLSGNVQGSLTALIWGFSLPMYINLVKDRKEYKQLLVEFHEKLNTKSKQIKLTA